MVSAMTFHFQANEVGHRVQEWESEMNQYVDVWLNEVDQRVG